MSVYETTKTNYLLQDVTQLLNYNVDVEVPLEDRAARIGYILEFLISQKQIDENMIEIYNHIIELLKEKLCIVSGDFSAFQIVFDENIVPNTLTLIRYKQQGNKGLINISTTSAGLIMEEKTEYDICIGITPTNIAIHETADFMNEL